MRILFLCRSYPPAVGGAETAAKKIVNVLKKEHEVFVASGTSHSEADYYLEMEGNYCKSKNLNFLLESTKGKFDCYFCFGFAKFFSDYTINWCYKNEKLCIFMPVGYFHTKNHQIYKKIYSWLIAPKTFKNSDVIITATKWERDFWIKKYKLDKEKFVVIPHELEKNFNKFKKTNILKEKGLKEKDYILYFGRAGPNKLIKTLIKSYIELMPEEKLVIAGLNTNNEGLKSLANKHGEKINSIVFLGEVNEDDKKTLISEAKLCVFPSSYESYGIFIDECTELQTPLILSNIPPFREIINDNRLFFENTIDSLKERLSLSLENPIIPKIRKNADMEKVFDFKFDQEDMFLGLFAYLQFVEEFEKDE